MPGRFKTDLISSPLLCKGVIRVSSKTREVEIMKISLKKRQAQNKQQRKNNRSKWPGTYYKRLAAYYISQLHIRNKSAATDSERERRP
jgi:hypothetical protein